MPSIPYHTGGKEDHMSSWRLDTTPTPSSGSCPTRILSKSQISAIPLESRFPRVVKDCPDKVLALPHDTIAAQRLHHSTMAHSSEKAELGDSNDDAKAAGIREQVTRGLETTVEGEDVTIVSYAHLQSMQLTSIQSGATGELATFPRTLSPSTASRFKSTAPCIPGSASNLHLGSTTPLPHSTPSPRSSTNSISQPSAHLPSKTRYSLSNPIQCPPTVQKRPLKAQQRRFGSSRVSPTITPPFQRQSLKSYLTHPPFRPYQDEQRSPKEPPSLITEDLLSDTSSPVHGIPSISPPTSSHNINLTPFPAAPTSPSSILWGPSLAGTSPLSPNYENRATSTKSDVLSHSVKDTTVRLCDSVSLHNGDPKGWRSSEFEDRVAQVINRVTGEGVTGEMLPDTLLRCSQEHRRHPRCRNLYQHQAALHSRPPTPFLPKQRWSSLPPAFHRLNGFNGQTRRFAPPPVNSPTTPPFQQRWPNFYLTYPSPDTFQLYRDDQGIPKEPPPPIVVHNMSDTSSSIHDVPSMSPTLSRDFYSYSPSLRSHLSTPSPPKRRSSSLPPTLRRLENCCGQQLLKSQPSIPMTPASAYSPPISCQQQHNTRNERSRTPPSRAASTIKFKGFDSPITPHTPCPPPRPDHRPGEVFTPKIAAQCVCSSTLTRISNARESGNGKDKARVAGIDEQATKEIDVEAEGEVVTMVPSHPHPALLTSVGTEVAGEPIRMLASALFSSVASLPTPKAPYMSTSAAPYMSDGTPRFHSESAIPLPHSFASASSRPPTHSSSKKQRTQQSVLAAPFDSYSTHLAPDPSQPYQDERRLCKGSLPSVAVNNAGGSSLPSHGSHPIPPSATAHDFCQYPASPHLHPPAPSSSKRRYSSLSPTFRQPKTTWNECSRTPPSRAASAIGCKGFMSSLTPPMPYHPPWANQPSPGNQDEQVPKVPTLPGIPRADSDRSTSSMTPFTSSNDLSFSPIASPPYSNKRGLLSTMHFSDSTRFPTTPALSPSILWDPDPVEVSTVSPTDKNRALLTKSDVLLLKDPDICSCDSILLHSGNPKEESEERVAEVVERVTGGGAARGERIDVEGMWTPLSPILRTSDCSTPNAPIPQTLSSMGSSPFQIPIPCASPPGHLSCDVAERPSTMPIVQPCPRPSSLPSGSLASADPLDISSRVSLNRTPTSQSQSSHSSSPLAFHNIMPLHDSEDATICSPDSVLLREYELQLKCSSKPTMPAITETENELPAPHRLGMEEGFMKFPMARLMQEYSLARTNITLVLSLEELTLDLIVDRGENRNKRLPRYYLGKATMNNICGVVSAQQILLQEAATLIVERKSHFIVDPGNTLILILQGTSSLPQMYTVWRALITRIKLGVRAWEKYIVEYELQEGAAAISLPSTLHC